MITQLPTSTKPTCLEESHWLPPDRWQELRNRVIDELACGRRMDDFIDYEIDANDLQRWLETSGGGLPRIIAGFDRYNPRAIADRIEQCLQQLAGAAGRVRVPRVETSVTRALLDAAETAASLCAWVDFSAPAGLGKTEARNEYLARVRKRDGFNAPVWSIKLDETSVSVKTLLYLIAQVVAVAADFNESNYSRMARAIVEATRGRRGVLIIDEAQHLADATKSQGLNALNQLRSFVDDGCFGVVTMGNGEIYRRLVAGRGDYAQLLSRMQDYRVEVAAYRPGKESTAPALTKDDILAVAHAWGVAGVAEQAWCLKVAAGPGALRSMVNLLKIARTRFDSLDIRCLNQVRKV